jgi:hypothetical protein
MRRIILLAVPLAIGCFRTGSSPRSIPAVITVERTRSLLAALADDSMEGRRLASAGEARAARFIAARFREAGLQPAGDDGYLQHLRLALTTTRSRSQNGQERTRTLPQLMSREDFDTVPPERRLTSVNVLGVLRGSDPELSSEVVVVAAHFDHLGFRPPVDGDSIANGADDDASGVVAVMETARIMAAGPRPKRTLVFVAFTGEESGGYGVRWYIQNPPFPLERHVAEVQVEMIGRPDTAVGPGKAWLTGYERSTMGSALTAAGLPVVADPRPSQDFYRRSDNYELARLGIIAHTLSTGDAHKDYHTVNDEVEFIDFAHMTEMVNLVVRAVRIVADGPRLQWNPGGKP